MSREDFAFYTLGGLPEMVIPHPANDRYKGLYVPSEGGLAEQAVTDILTVIPAELVEVNTVPGKFAREIKHALNAVRTEDGEKPAHIASSRTLIRVSTGHKSVVSIKSQKQVLEWVHDVKEILGHPRPLSLVDKVDDSPDSETIKTISSFLIPNREIKDYRMLLLGNCVGRLKFADWLLTRAYLWAPGPERTSKHDKNKKLEPVYNPKPTSLLLAASVRVDFVNSIAA